MFYSVGIFRTSSQGGSVSSNPEKTAIRKRTGEPGYIGVLQQRADGRNKILLLIKENWKSQGNSELFDIGRCKSLDSLKSFFGMHLSYLWLESCVFTS